MKKIFVLVLALSLVACAAMAQDEAVESKKVEIGLRAGYTMTPDQFHFGAHADLGQVIAPLRLVPNIEIGFGDNITMVCLNGDLIYDFADTPFSVGGELGINYVKYDLGDLSGFAGLPGFDIDDTSTDLGLSILGNYNYLMSNGKTLLLEVKIGLSNSADAKITVGYNFF